MTLDSKVNVKCLNAFNANLSSNLWWKVIIFGTMVAFGVLISSKVSNRRCNLGKIGYLVSVLLSTTKGNHCHKI